MERLLYISESRMHPSEHRAGVDDLVACSLIKNAELNITGALLFTGSRFAQVLEGPVEPLNAVMASINVDIRHHNIVIFDRRAITVRQFSDWSLAYHGPSTYVSTLVLNLLASHPNGRQRASERLVELLYELAIWRPLPTS